MTKILFITGLLAFICSAWKSRPQIDEKKIILAIIDELKEQDAINFNTAKDSIFIHFLDTAFNRKKYFYHKDRVQESGRPTICDGGAYNHCLFIYSDKMKTKPGLNELNFKFVNAAEYTGTVHLEIVDGQPEVKDIVCCAEMTR